MINLNALSDKRLATGNVGLNLTRLISGANGAGGAGVFALFLARALAQISNLSIYVLRENRDLVDKYLRRHADAFVRTQVRVVDTDDFQANLARAVAGCSVWIDPLNGLEPDVMPEGVFAVTVIHDLLFQNRPFYFSKNELKFRSEHYGSAIARADMVWTVSDYEKTCIETRYKTAKVRPIYQPAYHHQAPTMASGGPVSNKRILFYPAVQWNHKNQMGLVEAFLALCEEKVIPEDVVLLLSGVIPVEDNTRLYMEAAKASVHGDRVIEVPYLENAEYDKVMQSCLGLVFPSVYEGYGIPAMEAAYSGVPMLASDVPSLDKFVELPQNLQIIGDSTNFASLYHALKEFILATPPRQAGRSDVPGGISFADFDNQVANLLTEIRGLIAGGVLVSAEAPADTWPKVTQKQKGVSAWVVCDPATDVNEISQKLEAWQREMEGALAGTPFIVRPVLSTSQVDACHNMQLSPVAYLKDSVETSLAYHLVFCPTECLMVVDLSDLGEISAGRVKAAVSALKIDSDFNCVNLREHGNSPLGSRLCGLLDGRMLNVGRLELPLSATTRQVVDIVSRNLNIFHEFDKVGVHVFDPALQDNVGHHAALAKMWLNGATTLGYRTSLVVHHNAKLDHLFPNNKVNCLFSDYLYGNVGDIGLFQYEIGRAAIASGVRAGDFVFLFCATPAMLAGTVAWLLTQPEQSRPIFLVRFDRTQERTTYCRLTYAEAFTRVRTLGLRKYFRFYTESKGLQAYFERCANEQFPLLFNPLPTTSNSVLSELLPKEESDESKDTVVLGYLGEARLEKGFQKLPFVIEYLLSDLAVSERVRFRIQVSMAPQNQLPEAITAKQSLIQLAKKYPVIELMEYLSDDDYVKALNSLDLLLLPYDLSQYTVRGSGVATEAIAADVPMVVARGLDLANTFEGMGVVEPADHSMLSFANAVREAVVNIAELKARVKDVRQSFEGFSFENAEVVRRLIEDHQVDPAPSNGLVLLLINDTDGEGNTAVFKSQRRYLEERGFGVIELKIPYPNEHRFTSGSDDIEWNEMMAQMSYHFRFIDSPGYRQVLKEIKTAGHSYNLFWNAWKWLYIPDGLRRILKNNSFQYVVVNYSHHLGVLAGHDLVPDAPLVLEAHDIQAYQYAIQQDRPPDPEEILSELETLRDFDHVISISASEAKVMGEVVGQDKVTWCLPAVSEQTFKTADIVAPEPAHVMFVGSSHEANVASLRWFLQNVYEPVLYAEGVTLAIVGNCGSHVNIGHLSDRVTWYGRVPDLRPFYEAVDIIALPVVMGAGVPIKVLDAFRHGKPFSLHAFPGKALALPDDFPVVNTGLAMAQDILGMLIDKSKAEARAAEGKAYYDRFASPTAFDARWDQILASADKAFSKRLPAI
jgi:glycosyltransferase involved in cell wall biosynthesis